MKCNVLIIPASDEEKEWENIKTLREAVDKMENHPTYTSASLHEFGTTVEAEAFIKGYEAGIGWNGNGHYFKDYQ